MNVDIRRFRFLSPKCAQENLCAPLLGHYYDDVREEDELGNDIRFVILSSITFRGNVKFSSL